MVVVLFSYSMRPDADVEAEAEAGERMWAIASAMPGFVSYKTYTASDGETIAVVRFESQEDLMAWAQHRDHLATQRRAREEWYEDYWVQASETFREYRFSRSGGYRDEIPRDVFLAGSRSAQPQGDIGSL
jgi:heme-degrading monooxygenase HmoA